MSDSSFPHNLATVHQPPVLGGMSFYTKYKTQQQNKPAKQRLILLVKHSTSWLSARTGTQVQCVKSVCLTPEIALAKQDCTLPAMLVFTEMRKSAPIPARSKWNHQQIDLLVHFVDRVSKIVTEISEEECNGPTEAKHN